MRPFNLIRYFTLASLGVVAVLALATAWTFSRNLEHSLTDEAGLYAEDIARSLNRAIFAEFLQPRIETGEPIDLEDPAQRAALDAVVEERIRDLRILTVNLFDRTGTIIYSSNPAYIGYRSLDNEGLQSAMQGKTASVLKRAELEQDPIRPGHDLLESYVPFYELDPDSERRGERIGVIELYQDARPITAKIEQGQRQILLATAGLMLVLFVSLFAIVRRGHLRIQELTDALEDSNRELEARVQDRTREIEQARRRLRSLFDGIADGISVIDRVFSVSEHNSGIERLFGTPAPGDARRCHERYAGRATPCPGCPALATMRTGRAETQRFRWPAEDGAERELEVTTFPFTTAEHTPCVIEVVRDVSERAELERQVIQSESLASLGEMAAGVAHEIRNPIGMITSSAQMLARADGLSERDLELLGVIRAETQRVNETISEFVGFASPPAPSRVATDPGALLGRTCTILRPEAERRKLDLDLACEEDLPRILVDPELLYRALANLLLNAMQVQDEGGRVQLAAARAPDGGVELEVRDHGPGIDDADLERIFQPFFSRRSGGTGLGLSIVQRIVTANGGRIRVSSGPDGTTFTLWFAEAEK